MSSVGSVLDVGGQNASTVKLVSEVLHKCDLPALIIDLNSATPALTHFQPNIKYAVGDAYLFFSSDQYHGAVRDVINDAPTLVLFNNLLNVLKAKDGWRALQAAWSRLRPGDYLFISGLVPEQLEQHGMKKQHELDGIIEFHHRQTQKFYKSALSPGFSDFLETKLKGSAVLIKETFTHTVEAKRSELLDVHGYRLLASRKI